MSPSTLLLASAVFAALVAAIVYAVIQRAKAVQSPSQRTLTRLTFDAGLQSEPTWSPDGRFIAYSSDKSGNFDIWVQPVGGGDAVQVTKSAAHEWQPDWSPDGNQMVFRSERDGGGLFVVPVLGGRERRVSPFGYRPRWSPDGTKILFLKAGSNLSTFGSWAPKVFVVSVDGKAPYEVLPDIDFTLVRSAIWHPDGQRISLLGEIRPAGWGFWTVPLAGGKPVRSEPSEALKDVRDQPGIESNIRWAPSGRAVYFRGFSQNVLSLWKVAIDPQTLRFVAGAERLTTGSDDMDIALSPDGKRLAFIARSESTVGWSLPFDARAGKVNGAGSPVTAPGIRPGGFNLSSDGRHLLYLVLRTGSVKSELWVKSLEDNRETRATLNEQYMILPTWSRDGSRISYHGRCSSCTGHEKNSIFVLPSGGGTESVIVSGAEDLPSDWSADGQWILASSDRASPRRWGEITLYPLSAAPHAETQRRVITSHPQHDLFGARFSPDDRWVCFQATKGGGRAVVYVVPSSGGDWIRITEDAGWSDAPRFSPDGKTIYYVSPRVTGFLNIWGIRFDPARGRPVGEPFPVTSYDSPGRMMSGIDMALSADRLVLPITELTGSIWVLDNVDQ
jgi:Tol biopolymer transport system component